MKFKRAAAALLAGAIAAICAAPDVAAQRNGHTTQPQNTLNTAPATTQGTLRLEDLERMALANNPTIEQADAAIRAAEGRRKQAGLWPNPVVGYEGDGIAANELVRDFRIGHYLWVEQSVVGFGKLSKSKRIAEKEKVQSVSEAEAQRLRVLNAVRMLYFEVLGAQRMVDLRKRLLELTREAVDISEELFNVGQADRPDVLSTEVESQRAEIDLMRAENDLGRVWRVMAAVVNDPQLKAFPRPARLEGSLEAGAPEFDQEELLAQLLRESPEIKAAMAGVARAKAVVDRAKAEPRPDWFVKAWVGHSRDFAEFFGGLTGWETRVEAGVRIPLFNRNQGNVASARAELTSAENELERVELALRARLAETFNNYQNSLAVAARYSRQILPRAQQAYDMYLSKFRQMAAAYPQALIAQRTLFQSQTEYVAALVDLWQNVVQLRGMLLMGGLDAPASMRGAEMGNTGRTSLSPASLPNDQ
jgi:outer membrane protein, heavy metal efflux system